MKGDALIEGDVQRAWNEAGTYGRVDLLLFTVGKSQIPPFAPNPRGFLLITVITPGGTPSFHLLKGFIITPENLVTQSLLNVLCTMPRATPEPKIITISSTGLTKTSHAALPFLLKPLYGYLLAVPHKDKVGAERVISHCAGWDWNSAEDGEPGEEIMGSGDWRQRAGLPAAGTLKKAFVIRPALLTDGGCVAEGSDNKSYRVSEAEFGGRPISRKDVAHFVVDIALNRWDEFENKVVNIAY